MAVITSDIRHVSQLPSILPEPYEAAWDHTKSKDTRKPGAYDLHLDPSLQLRKVELSRDLPKALQRLYDKEVNSTLLATPLARFNMTATKLSRIKSKRKPIKNESGIRDDYYPRTGKFCIALASAILHHKYAKALGKAAPTGGDQFVPLFTIDNTETTKEPALPDLCIKPGLRDDITPEIKEKIDEDIALLKKHFLSTICFLEVKSLIAADEEAMSAIVELGTEGITNEWMKCEVSYLGERVLCDYKGVTESRKKHTKKDGQQKRTGRRMGPDSAVQFQWRTDDPPATGSGGQSPAEESFARDHQPSTWPRKATDENHLKARYIVQQVWSELVAVDGTFGIISSGNHEIIARRDRDSQTLYISDVIRPSTDKNPSHYILHAALYVASWLDAVDRAKQLDGMTKDKRTSITKEGGSLPTWWKRYEQGIYDGDKLAYSADMDLPTITKAEQEREQSMACKNLSGKLLIANEIYVDIPSPNTSQQKFKAARFYRVPVSLENGLQDNTIAPTPRVAIQQDSNNAVGGAQSGSTRKENLTLYSPRKLSEAVYQVTVAADGYSSDLFVIKIARNAADQAKLLTECKEYLQIKLLRSQRQRSVSVIFPSVTVQLFGMFTCSLGEDTDYNILVLAHGGIPAEQPLEASQSEKHRYVQKLNEVSKQTEITLAEYHDHYGRVHNRLLTPHVMYNPADKEIRLISLAHASSIAEFEKHTKTRRDLIRRDRAQLVIDGLIEELVEPENQEFQVSPTRSTRKRRADARI